MTAIDDARHLELVATPEDQGRAIDRGEAERAAAGLLTALGADLRDEQLRDTPRRMADAYAELLTPEPFRPTTFPDEQGYDELVLVRSIPFHCLCMHHMLPFQGMAHIGYLPGGRIVGLSKLARVVEFFARELQLQERLTTQIAGWVQERLEPKGVGVVLQAEHLFMSLRGVQKFGAKTVTSALSGLVRDDPRTRQEFLALTTRSTHEHARTDVRHRRRQPRRRQGRRDAARRGLRRQLVLIGDEPERPYERPPLTKDYLRAESPREKAYVHPEAFYREHDIELMTDTTVTALDPARSRITLDGGRELGYDRLLLTTGAEPRRIPVPGAELDGIHYLRTLADCDALRERLDNSGGHVVVIGSGWIGAEFAASARHAAPT